MKYLAVGLSVLALVLGTLVSARQALAQTGGRTAYLAVLPVYGESDQVEVDGSVSTVDGGAPQLADWGIVADRGPWRGEPTGDWYIHGRLARARVLPADSSGYYHLQVSSLALAPGDSVTLVLPFADVDYERAVPRPTNLEELRRATARASPITPSPGLEYKGDSGHSLTLDLPFAPVQKQIALAVIPLIGRMMRGNPESFEISGSVTFSGIRSYVEFARHCEGAASSPLVAYRVADLLFSLDFPPVRSAGYLSPFYQFKPSYLMVRSDLSACHLDSKGGRVDAAFSGNAFVRPADPSRYPSQWQTASVVESNRQVETLDGEPQYQLRLGTIRLAPGDVLTVTIPGTDIREVSPPPTRIEYRPSQTAVVYEGPRQFDLVIGYQPRADLVLGQLPEIARSLVQPIEGSLSGPHSPPLILGLLLLALAPSLAGGISRARARTSPKATDRLPAEATAAGSVGAGSRFGDAGALLATLGWVIAGVVLFYALRGIYGLLVLAGLMYLVDVGLVDACSGRGFGNLTRSVLGLGLIGACLLLDRQVEGYFVVLNTLDLEITPFTPLLMLVLGLALVYLLAFPEPRAKRLLRRENLPTIGLALVTFVVFDVLQKSLLGVLLLAVGGAYVALRAHKEDAEVSLAETGRRLGLLWRSRVVPAGIVILVLFAGQSGIQSTTAVFGSALGLWGALLVPALVIVSIVQGFLAVGLLFVVLYPVLPFRSGYLKALALALFLLLLFVVGTGSREQLVPVLGSLVVGRLAYYLFVPLLIGLYLDVDRAIQDGLKSQAAEGTSPGPVAFGNAFLAYLKRIQGLGAAVGTLASLVLPTAYALVAGSPLMTSYFTILQNLVLLTAPR